MGDGPTWNYMKGFYVSMQCKDRDRAKQCLDVLGLGGEGIEKGEFDEEECEDILPDFIEDFKKLPHYELIWAQGEESWCSFGDQGGGGVGWHWKKQSMWDGYDPSEKDLAALKNLLKKHGFKVGERINEDILSYTG